MLLSLPIIVRHFLALVTAVYRRFLLYNNLGPGKRGRITAGYSLPWDLCTGDRICQFQLIHHDQIHISLFVPSSYSTSTVSLYSLISLTITPMSPLKTPMSFIYRQTKPGTDFPFQLIIILYLHHFVSFTEQPSVNLPFRLFFVCRVQVFLKDHIHSFYSQKSFSCRCHHLDLIGMCLHILRQLFSGLMQ